MTCNRWRLFVLVLILLSVAACRDPIATTQDADVIVVGAGVAGLAAALEAEAQGARVLVIEANSVPGGQAVHADRLALIDTPLQRARGIRDSGEIAARDLLAWGEDNDPGWTHYYAQQSRAQVHDWLTSFGVRFGALLDSSEAGVPRLHVVRGGAVNAVVPMMRAALKRRHIGILWNTEATRLLRRDGRMAGVYTRRLRDGPDGPDGRERLYRAPAVILASGGFQNDLALTRRSAADHLANAPRLLSGGGEFARGRGLQLVEPFGAARQRLDQQLIFINGLPDPRDAAGLRGLRVDNSAAIWVDATGRRFTNEAASRKVIERALLALKPATHWLIFDAEGAKQLRVNDAVWLSATTIRQEILDNLALVQQADSIAALADASGLPRDALADTVQRYNRFVETGADTDFGRIGPGIIESPPALRKPPFYAIRLYPMTGVNLGGLRVDQEARVLGGADQVIRGLFAAGEATGFAGINGRYGSEGMFLGPAVLMGRVAGRAAAESAPGLRRRPSADAPPRLSDAPRLSPAPDIDLAPLLARQRPGYWHFDLSHTLVAERGQPCGECHKGAWSTEAARTRAQRLVQLESCDRCH